MKLPSELRALVYNFALEDLINEIETASSLSPLLRWNLPNLGLPALLKIKCISLECSDAMRLAARAHLKRHESLEQKHYDKIVPSTMDRIHTYYIPDTTFLSANEIRKFGEYDTTLRRLRAVESITRKIEGLRDWDECLKKGS